ATLGVAAMGFPWSVQRIQRGDGTLLVTVRADPHSDATPATWASILDAALSTASVCFAGPPILRMPAHIHRVTLAATSPAQARIAVRRIADDTVDVEISDLDGRLLGRLSRLRYGVLEGDLGAVANPRRLVHEMVWRPVTRDEQAQVRAGQPRVVLVGPDTALLGRLTERLAGADLHYRIAATADELTDADLTSEHTLLVVPALGPADQPGEAAASATWLLARTGQRLAAAGLANPARLWCVTQGVRECVGERSLSHGSLWGLGRIIGGEHPEFWGGVIDIGQSAKDIPALIEVLRTVRGEDVVVIRDGEPSVPRLHHLDREPERGAVTCQPDGTYLITGGLGALGLEVAHWLAGRGARRIVLVGRRALPGRDQWDQLTDASQRAQVESIRSLERLGVTVATLGLDIADPVAARHALASGSLGLPPIRGVVHAAGVLDDRTLRTLDEPSLRRVLRPKVDGAVVLHHLFPPGMLDFFVLFSSCGQLLGLTGQSSYAAGNAFLDTLAAHRRAAGDAGTISFGWTSWRGLGMSTSSAVIDAELAARGTADITVAEAFSAWELAERYPVGFVAVLRTLPLEPGERRPPLLSELPTDAPSEEGPANPADTPWHGLTGEQLREALADEIRRQVAAETKLAATEVDPRRPLIEMGIDSVMTVRIRRALERRFRLPLPATLFWDRPTIDAIAALLAQRIGGDVTTDEGGA
ncbi:MAG TPA: beta-ketoacyl reductase, partial [Micromonosporaceae bacterium]